jgi:branched-chain amino acid transport system substrate-binding protein
MEDEEGAVATFANESIHMAQLAVNYVNANGGVDCHQMKLYVADETTSASSAANTLVLQDHISALVGITYAGDAEAIFPFLSQHNIITIMTTASNNALLTNLTTDYSAYQYFFRITPTDTDYAQSAINFTASVIKPSSIYFVAEDLSFSHELFANISNYAASAGISVSGSTFVPLTTTDFTTYASTVAAANPGLVIDCQTGSGAGSFIQDLRAADPTVKMLYMCNGALADPGFQGYLESSDATLLDGVVFQVEPSTATVPLNNVSTYVATQYTAAMGSDYPYYSFVANDYSAVIAIAAALRTAGTISNVTAALSALETVSVLGPTGTIQFNAQHTYVPGFWYTQIQAPYTEKVIYPSAYANGTYNATLT